MSDVKGADYRLATLIVGLALLPQVLLIGTPYTTNVSGAYLLDGLRLYYGSLPIETQHGPLFALLVSLIFKAFGVSIVGAVLLVKGFFVLAALAFFLFCSQLFGKWVAFAASILVLLSRPIYTQLNLHIYLDTQVLALEFCFLYFFVKTLAVPTQKGFCLSGLFLGLALLTKENALFFVPYPLFAVMMLRRWREKGMVEGLCLLYGVFVLVMLPWLVFLQGWGPGMVAALGWLTPTLNNLRNWGVSFEGKSLIENLWLYNPVSVTWYLFRDRIFPTEILGRFYPVAIALVLVRLIFAKRDADLLFGLALASSFPLAFITGAFGDRLGHMPEFLFLMHATLPIAVVTVKDIASQKHPATARSRVYQFPFGRGARRGVVLAAVLAIFLVPSRPDSLPDQGFGNSSRRLSWLSEMRETMGGYGTVLTNLSLPFAGGNFRLVAGRHAIELETTGRWLMENMESDAVIITDGTYDDPMRFYTRMGWPVISRLYPRFSPSGRFYKFDKNGNGRLDEGRLEGKGRVLFVTNTPLKFRSQYYRYRSLLLIFEDDFQEWVQFIFRPKAYLVIHKESKNQVPQIDGILLDSSVFRHLHGQGVVRVLQPLPAEKRQGRSDVAFSELPLDPRIVSDLKWMADNYPDEFKLFLDLLQKSQSEVTLAQLRQAIPFP